MSWNRITSREYKNSPDDYGNYFILVQGTKDSTFHDLWYGFLFYGKPGFRWSKVRFGPFITKEEGEIGLKGVNILLQKMIQDESKCDRCGHYKTCPPIPYIKGRFCLDCRKKHWNEIFNENYQENHEEGKC